MATTLPEVYSCLFCYKICTGTSDKDGGDDESLETSKITPGERSELQHRFFRQIEREKIGGVIGGNNSFDYSGGESQFGWLSSCQECWALVESWCDINHRMKVLQLEANWKLDQLTKVIECADRMTSSWALSLKTFVDGRNGDVVEDNEEVAKFRKGFIGKCKFNLKWTPPVLTRSRCEVELEAPAPKKRNCGAYFEVGLKQLVTRKKPMFDRNLEDGGSSNDDQYDSSDGDYDKDPTFKPTERPVQEGPPDKVLHRCKTCGKGFDHIVNYRKHMLTHESARKGPYKCQYCSRKFAVPNAWRSHTFHAHRVQMLRKYKEECHSDEIFRRIIMIVFQRLVKDKKCTICGWQHSNKFVCERHIMYNHHQRLSDELIEFQQNPLPPELKALAKSGDGGGGGDSGGGGGGSGGVAQKESSEVIKKLIHAWLPGQVTHRCPICNRNCKNSQTLKKHLASHVTHASNRPRNHPCTFCDSTFAEVYNLNGHITSMHRVQLLSEHMDKSVDEEEFHKMVVDVYASATTDSGKSCALCGRKWQRRAGCEQHVLFTHRDHLVKELKRRQNGGKENGAKTSTIVVRVEVEGDNVQSVEIEDSEPVVEKIEVDEEQPKEEVVEVEENQSMELEQSLEAAESDEDEEMIVIPTDLEVNMVESITQDPFSTL